MKFFKISIFCIFLIFSNLIYACDEHSILGQITLGDIINSSKEIANSKSSKFVHKNLPGSIVKINGVKYEVRFFSFEDTLNSLPKNISFSSYASKNNLLTLASKTIVPLEGIIFESFDFRRTDLKDGVYFSMAFRKID